MPTYTLPVFERKALTLPAHLVPRRISRADLHLLFRRILASGEPKAMAWLKQVWSSLGRQITPAVVDSYLERGQIPVSVSDAVKRELTGYVDGKLATVARNVAKGMGGAFAADAGSAFDAAGKRLLETIARRLHKLPVEMTEDQLRALDLLMRYYTTTQQAPAGTIATRVRQFVGLTEREARAVTNLEAAMRKAEATERAIAARLKNYSNSLRQARALRIARTELAFSAQQGQREAVQQAIEQGVLTGQVVRIWDAAEDEATCPICSDLDGRMAALGEPFTAEYDDPPAHPACRCLAVWSELERV